MHPGWGVSVVVHGDDFTALGTAEGLDAYEKGMQEAFECKLKGRLGTGANDCKEMRVLNRIVRITNDGLLYEADPRHAEMLIKAFNLEGAKAVVTPGVKSNDFEGDPDKIDQDYAAEINAIHAEIAPSIRPMAKVTFSTDVDFHEITPYSMIYGRHPREFEFGRHGKIMLIKTPHVDDGMVRSHSVSPNESRAILERTLRNGAAWEIGPVE